MLFAVKLARRIAAADALAPYRGAEELPGPEVKSDDELRDYLRRFTITIYHPVGAPARWERRRTVVQWWTRGCACTG